MWNTIVNGKEVKWFYSYARGRSEITKILNSNTMKIQNRKSIIKLQNIKGMRLRLYIPYNCLVSTTSIEQVVSQCLLMTGKHWC